MVPRKAIRSATSCGFAGRPIGIPPRDSIIIFSHLDVAAMLGR